MSHRALSGAQFFHGSDEEFKPGDTVLPQAQSGKVRFAYADPKRAESMYMTGRHTDARHYGKHVYEVNPQGAVRPDPEEHDSYMAPSATVVRRVGRKR